MRHPLRHLLVLLTLIVLYLLVFPISTGEELVIRRAWSVSARNAPLVTTSPAATGPLIPVDMTDSFAYLTGDGLVVGRGIVAHRIALSPYGFIGFGRDPDQLVLQNPDGSFQATIPQSGYPQFSGDGFFVKSGGDTVVAAYSPDGNMRWRAEFEGQVASLSSRDGLSLLLMLSGGIVVIDSLGRRIPVEGIVNPYTLITYGGAIHAPSGLVAAVYGPTDPSIILHRLTADQLIPALRVGLSGNPGRQIAVAITDDGDQLIVDDEGVRIIEVASGAQLLIPSTFPLLDIATESDYGVMMTLGIGEIRDPGNAFRFPAELIAMDHGGVVPVRALFAADKVSLATLRGSYYLAADDRVLKFSLGAE